MTSTWTAETIGQRSAPDAATDETIEIDRLARFDPAGWFGFPIGADRQLARWPALLTYFSALASASDRLQLTELGLDTGGQPLVALTLSSPANLDRLDQFQEIQQRLADPRTRSAHERSRLIDAGRAVVVISCSIHATEIAATQMTPELVHRLLTATDAETERTLDEVVLVLLPSLNPSGLEVVADWYEQTLGTPFEGSNPPALYHPYAGHDNNRDWFMQTQIETRLVVDQIHNRWRPQIVFDLHQMQTNGPRYVLPPFLDPYDPLVDPLIQSTANEIGMTIAADLLAAGKPGVATGAIFDAFSPSRSYQHYHGGVRILAEAAGVKIASPIEIAENQLTSIRGFDARARSANQPEPWHGGTWRLRDIVEYHAIACRSLLRHAARNRDRVVATFASIQDRAMRPRPYWGLAIPDLDRQRDPTSTAELIEILRAADVEVERIGSTTDAFDLHPSGTFIIRAAQPFGRFAETLLGDTPYPQTPSYPSGPPRQPYDVTSHNLPRQMGVAIAKLDHSVDARLDPVEGEVRPPGGLIDDDRSSDAYAFSSRANGSFKLLNRLLAEGASVTRLSVCRFANGRSLASGDAIVSAISPGAIDELGKIYGIDIYPARRFATDLPGVRIPRVGVYRSWRPDAIDEGWLRFVLEEYLFPYRTLRDADIHDDDALDSLDAIILPHQAARDLLNGNDPAAYPARVAGGLGDRGLARLRYFVEAGGTLVAIDGACQLVIGQFELPVRNVLDGLSGEAFSCPGALLRLLVDPTHPVAWGCPPEMAAMFLNGPAFDVRPGGRQRIVARFPFAGPLAAGWIHGEDKLAGRAAIVELRLGHGRVVLIGIRPHFRAQTRGSYRLLFNTIYHAATVRAES